MSQSFTLQVVKDTATGLMKEASERLSLGLLTKAIGHDCTEMTKSHLRTLDYIRPNRLGGDRTHYYAKAAQSTRYSATPGEILIAIQQPGIRLHYHGGTVTPKLRKWLTIPARAEAHGHRAREFELTPFYGKKGIYALALTSELRTKVLTRGKRKGQSVPDTSNAQAWTSAVMYWLTKLATFQPDPSVIPNEQAFIGQAAVTLNRINEDLKRGQKGVGNL